MFVIFAAAILLVLFALPFLRADNRATRQELEESMGTLYGFVFLSHQLGSFPGVGLGGRMYGAAGD